MISDINDELNLSDKDHILEEDAAILASFREGFRDALAGRVRPAREVLAEVHREIAADNEGSESPLLPPLPIL